MNKPNKRDTLNLVFSAFLILGYIVCSYFFLSMAQTMPDIAPYINTLVFVVFGLVVFYATRVGEGKAVKRFSLWTLLILDIPALYIVLAQLVEMLPLHQQIANLDGTAALPYSPLFMLACVALGYGIPYTFLSGYELATEAEADEAECEEECCGCCDCEELRGMYVLSTEDAEGALLVVDDLDTAFDNSKEIRISDVAPCTEDVKVGDFVIFAQAEEASEETEEATEPQPAEEETAETTEASAE